MVQIKWSRILALALLLISPLVYGYLKRHISLGDFCSLPIVGVAAFNPELKGLMLLGIILISIVLVIKTVRRT